jgi:acyl transferase domain-containing protein
MPHDIAIIGLAGRFPGASGPDELWANLLRGTESITRFSLDELRAAGVPEAMWRDPAYVPAAGVLEDASGFDAELFQYSPAEAVALDPQHRLMHELAWEALEDAGCVPGSSAGPIGLFAGCGPQVTSYAVALGLAPDAPGGPLHISTDKDYLCTRVSYKLDLKGPALTVQTACSTSLVAVHLACQSLLLGESAVALAGGVNVRSPQHQGYLHEPGGIVSADGHCRPFDARADGTVFGSGGGLVVLKPLREALRDGDLVRAVIRGTAIGNDGAAKVSYAASSREGQARVIAEAFAVAEVEAETVGLVETHGTATALGDPIEIQALTQVFRASTERRGFCALGTLKANLGHLDAGAGVAGLIKATLALERELLPPAAYLGEPHPKLSLAEGPFYLRREPTPWPRSARPRRAGVSAFGIGGTNAHVVLEEAPAPPAAPPAGEGGADLLLWSAAGPGALAAQALRLAGHLRAHPEQALASICASAATTRAHLPHRAAAVGASAEEMATSLERFARGQDSRVLQGHARGERGPVAWLFTGQGAQRPGMGMGLYQRFPAFREALDRCVEGLRPWLPRPLTDILWAEPGSAEAALLDQTAWTQPALFCVGYALAELWRSFGARPTWVAGHSVGELTAACVAGVLSLQDGLQLVAARGRLMQSLPTGGAMASIEADEARVTDELARLPAAAGRACIAALNAPSQVVVSGDEVAVAHLCEALATSGVRARRLPMSHAFHSHRMDPILGAFGEVVAGLTLRAPQIPLVSNVSGRPAGEELRTAEYWVEHLRQPVRFADSLASLRELGVSTFVELGPRPTLLSLVSQGAAPPEPELLASLRPGQPEDETLLGALGAWYCRGGAPSASFFPELPRVRLPTYAFQRQRFWAEAARPAAPGRAGRWALSGSQRDLPAGLVHHVLELDTRRFPQLADHVVHGSVVVPGAWWLASVLAVAHERWPSVTLEGVEFVQALILTQGASVHLLLTPSGAGYRFEVATPAPEGWITHARGILTPGAAPQPFPRPVPGAALPAQALFDALASVQVCWGPLWRWFVAGHADEHSASGELSRPPGPEGAPEGPLPAALLDNAFGLALATRPGALSDPQRPYLPFAVERLRLHRVLSGAGRCHVRPRPAAAGSPVISLDLQLEDERGDLACEIEGLVLHRAPRERLLRQGRSSRERFELTWEPTSSERAPLTGRWLLLGHGPQELELAAAALVRAGGAAISALLGRDVDLSDPQRAQHTLGRAVGAHKLRGIVLLAWGGPEADPAQQAERLASWGLHLLQAVAKLARPAPTWWLTRAGEPAQAVLWGLGRVWQQEQPELALTLAELDEPAGLPLVLARRGEPQLRLRAGELAVPRLRPSPGEAPRDLSLSGTVCLTGGSGALGIEVGRWLLERGAEHLLLLSRSPEQALPGLERVTRIRCDVSDREALREALRAVPPELPLRGVIHTAGVLDDGLVLPSGAEGQTAARLAAVLAPKVRGAWNLHELTRDQPLDFFVLFSSASALWGSPGQSSYAAANSFLDALARHRQALGLPALSLQWGPWARVGMAARASQTAQARLAAQGLRPLEPERALVLLGAELSAQGCVTLASLDPEAPQLPRMASGLQRPTVPGPAGALGLWPQLRELPDDRRLVALRELVTSEVARAVPHRQGLEPGLPFRELGMDSLGSLDLRKALSVRLGRPLPATLTFDHPNIDAVTHFLLTELLQGGTP